MFGNAYSEDQRPLGYIAGYPLHAATLIVAIYVATLFATTALMASGAGDAAVAWVKFDSRLLLGSGHLWRFFTYGLWNPPTLGFVVDMFMIVWFGRELEKFLGRKAFVRLYLSIYLLQPLVLTALGLLRPTVLAGETGAFALFIAFAALYPNVALLFNILAKWLATVLVGLYTLIALAAQDFVALILLWSTVGLAVGFVRHEQGRLPLPKFHFRPRGPKLRVVPAPAASRPGGSDSGAAEEMDRLLDKIAKSGIASLSSAERARLEKARQALLEREGR